MDIIEINEIGVALQTAARQFFKIIPDAPSMAAPIGSNEHLQQQCSQHLLRRNRRTPHPRIYRLKIWRQNLQDLVHHRPDRAQRAGRWNPSLAAHVRKQAIAPNVAAAHLDP